MKDNEEYTSNLDEKIYFICFVKNPSFPKEIARLLYGEDSTKKDVSYSNITVKTNQLEREGNLGYLPDYKPSCKKGQKIDGRIGQRKYYRARIDPFIFAFKNQIDLTDIEEYILRRILDSKTFRNYITTLMNAMKISFKDDICTRYNLIFTTLDLFAILHMKLKILTSIGLFIDDIVKTVDQYDILVKLLSELPLGDFDDAVSEARTNKLFDPIFEDFLKNEQYKNDFKEDSSVLLFASGSLMKKLKGISFLGKLDDFFFAPLYEGIEELEKIPDFDFSEFSEILKKAMSSLS